MTISLTCDGYAETPVGPAPRLATQWSWGDRLGAWRVRSGLGRMEYAVEPGLYAVGEPDESSPVLVTANYKLTLDCLRTRLSGVDVWILVIDTNGINVWCAAGAGTFCAEEVARQVEAARLAEVVRHRTLILPQLSAPGVAAHEVRERCGFAVVYGPVRAADIPAFLAAGMRATPEMRRVTFPLHDRIVLAPMELMAGRQRALQIAGAMLLLSGISRHGYSLREMLERGSRHAAIFLLVYVSCIVLTPALLPWLPGRAFAVKGVSTGALIAFAVGKWCLEHPHWVSIPLQLIGWTLIILALASFTAMNFTGASTYTSLSGVELEVRCAAPVQRLMGAAGAVLWTAGLLW